MSELNAGSELDLIIAQLMEPTPDPISARDLRAREMADWYSTHYAYSPDGWWKAQIGTDHNLDKTGHYQAARDLAPVRWEPAREPSSSIADAWLVAERLRAFSIGSSIAGTWHAWCWNRTHIGATASTAPLAICRVAVRGLADCRHEYEWVGGHSTPHGPIEPTHVCKHCGAVDDTD